MSQENKASKNAALLRQNLAAYNVLPTAYRLADREMDYKDAQREAAKYWKQLKARWQLGLYAKISMHNIEALGDIQSV